MISAKDPIDFEGIERSSQQMSLWNCGHDLVFTDEQVRRPTILNTKIRPPICFGCCGHCSTCQAGESATVSDPSSRVDKEPDLTRSCDGLVPALAGHEFSFRSPSPTPIAAVGARRRSICATAPPPILALQPLDYRLQDPVVSRDGDLTCIAGLVDLRQELRWHTYRHSNPFQRPAFLSFHNTVQSAIQSRPLMMAC